MMWLCHPGAWENSNWLVESCIWCRRPLQYNVHTLIHTNMVIQWWGVKKEWKEVCFPTWRFFFPLTSCACTKFWDIYKCPTTQHKTNHLPESREGWGEKKWALISIQDWSWLGLDSDFSQASLGKSPRVTAPSGVSDLAKCRVRTPPQRLV